MLNDSQYIGRKFPLPEIEHRYGSDIHILNDPYLFTTLAQLCSPQTQQPLINQLLNTLYSEMVKYVINNEFPCLKTGIESRMASMHPEGNFAAEIVDPNSKVVCVNLARAGTVPSHICYDSFNYILKPEGVRQDHIAINRKVNENEEVIGTNLAGVKIGGDVEDRFVVIPDPMGATGSTIETAMEIYGKKGNARKYIAIHLIITPEYLKLLTSRFPQLTVYAIRLDRGLSSADVLKTVPGTHWDQERGLNEKQYIVPGGGGLGEVINNAYV